MAMSNDVTQLAPEKLVEWARQHELAAERCVAARREHPRTIAAAASWGPMFADARKAAVDAVNAREAALIHQEHRHRAMARNLQQGAAVMQAKFDENARNLRLSQA
jgi:hypothetical protein